jgi:hypothetical protein
MTLEQMMSGVKMPFSHDTEFSLAEAAALVNTVGLDGDTLVTLWTLMTIWPGIRTPASFTALPKSSNRYAPCGLHCVGSGPLPTAMKRLHLSTRSLPKADARPYLARHDKWDWHLHVTRPDVPSPIGSPPMPPWPSST